MDQGSSLKDVFTKIYTNKIWSGKDTVSGPGSTLQATVGLRKVITEIIYSERIRSILDIPCGDYNWMQHIHRPCTVYHGADIVEAIIKKLKIKYENSMIKFKVLDITTSRLPIVELIIVRDCFVHLSLEQAVKALQNINKHRPKFLLITTFPNKEINADIEAGSWRPLNMTKAPFNLKPYKMYKDNEGTSKENKDKSLMLVRM